jgi:hypothetical protein
MFSSQLPKKNPLPFESLFAGVGLLLVVALLAGIASVASGQVKKAELRESLLASQRTAMASCLESLGGSALNQCLIDARATQAFPETRTTLADNGGGYSRSPAPAGLNPGFMAASFTTTQR